MNTIARSLAVLAAGIVIGAVLALAGQSSAEAQTESRVFIACTSTHHDPRGAHAQSCRDMGWVIKARLVVGPQLTVTYATLPRCANEDGSGGPRPCVWNFAPDDGNGEGSPLWVSKNGKVHPVKKLTQTVLDHYAGTA